jgi:hypothetical protein
MSRSFFMDLRIFAVSAALGGCAAGANSGGPPLGSMPQLTSPAARLPRTLQKTLFVADVNNNVLLYSANIKAHNPPLLGTITQGVTRSFGLGVDHRSGTLYVVNSGGSRASIAEYKQGTSSPFKPSHNLARVHGRLCNRIHRPRRWFRTNCR